MTIGSCLDVRLFKSEEQPINLQLLALYKYFIDIDIGKKLNYAD